MRVIEMKKKLILTKAEKRVICDLYEIFDEDRSITCNQLWDILTDIYLGENNMAQEYGYDIEIVD